LPDADNGDARKGFEVRLEQPFAGAFHIEQFQTADSILQY